MEPPVLFKVLRLDAKLDAATYAMVVAVVMVVLLLLVVVVEEEEEEGEEEEEEEEAVVVVVMVVLGRTCFYFLALILHSYSASCPVSAFRL
jgi:uncharacterized membrane protein